MNVDFCTYIYSIFTNNNKEVLVCGSLIEKLCIYQSDLVYIHKKKSTLTRTTYLYYIYLQIVNRAKAVIKIMQIHINYF